MLGMRHQLHVGSQHKIQQSRKFLKFRRILLEGFGIVLKTVLGLAVPITDAVKLSKRLVLLAGIH